MYKYPKKNYNRDFLNQSTVQYTFYFNLNISKSVCPNLKQTDTTQTFKYKCLHSQGVTEIPSFSGLTLYAHARSTQPISIIRNLTSDRSTSIFITQSFHQTVNILLQTWFKITHIIVSASRIRVM